jgi:hypothetical protein
MAAAAWRDIKRHVLVTHLRLSVGVGTKYGCFRVSKISWSVVLIVPFD